MEEKPETLWQKEIERKNNEKARKKEKQRKKKKGNKQNFLA